MHFYVFWNFKPLQEPSPAQKPLFNKACVGTFGVCLQVCRCSWPFSAPVSANSFLPAVTSRRHLSGGDVTAQFKTSNVVVDMFCINRNSPGANRWRWKWWWLNSTPVGHWHFVGEFSQDELPCYRWGFSCFGILFTALSVSESGAQVPGRSQTTFNGSSSVCYWATSFLPWFSGFATLWRLLSILLKDKKFLIIKSFAQMRSEKFVN